MRAHLGDQAETALPCERDPGGWLLTVDHPSEIELSLSDAYDGVGPLALRHYSDGREPEEHPVGTTTWTALRSPGSPRPTGL